MEIDRKIRRVLPVDSDGSYSETQDNLGQPTLIKPKIISTHSDGSNLETPKLTIVSKISIALSTSKEANGSNFETPSAQIDSKISRAFSLEANGSNFESEAFDLFHCLSEGSDNLSIEVSQFGLCCNPGPLTFHGEPFSTIGRWTPARRVGSRRSRFAGPCGICPPPVVVACLLIVPLQFVAVGHALKRIRLHVLPQNVRRLLKLESGTHITYVLLPTQMHFTKLTPYFSKQSTLFVLSFISNYASNRNR